MNKESISKIFNIREKRIPFARQETLANCGPLAIANGLNALQSVNPNYKVPKDFLVSSFAIRKLLASNEDLRKTAFGTLSSSEIQKDNRPLQTGHIANVIKKLESESNIKIIGDRFSAMSGFPAAEIQGKIQNADWLIGNKDFHYTSFIRINNDEWFFLDSMGKEPVVINQKFIEDNYQDIPGKNIAYFMAMKVEDKIKITPKEKPNILITKKE